MRLKFLSLALTAFCVFALLPPIASRIATASAQGQRGAQPGAPAGQQGGQGQGRGGGGGGGGRANTPTFPGPPAGMQALPLDMFLSKNFYKDKDLWSDKRYFRCNSPRQITDIWTSRRIGNN